MENHIAEVQADLQNYLNVKNINNLFIQIVENMLIEKPDNPISFMIEFLYKKFPEQACDASIKPPDSLIKELRKDRAGKPEIDRFLVELESKGDDDDVYDDNIRELPDVSHSIRHLTRRQGVSAEPVNPNAMLKAAARDEPKTEETMKRLTQIIRGNSFLCHLTELQQQSIIKSLALVTKSDGEVIIRQGEEEGSNCNFYIVESGNIDVYVNSNQPQSALSQVPVKPIQTNSPSKFTSPASTAIPSSVQSNQSSSEYGVKVMTYGPLDSFGELAILHQSPRAATCIAASPKVKLWIINRSSLQAILTCGAIQQRSERCRFMKSIPILTTLNDMEVNQLADAMVEEEFNSGQVICMQGAMGDKFFIVADGACTCWQKNSVGKDVLVSNLQRGDYFGEIALLTSKPRQATVKSSTLSSSDGSEGKVKLLSIQREAFHRLLGSLEDLLKRNMTVYNSVYASQI